MSYTMLSNFCRSYLMESNRFRRRSFRRLSTWKALYSSETKARTLTGDSVSPVVTRFKQNRAYLAIVSVHLRFGCACAVPIQVH